MTTLSERIKDNPVSAAVGTVVLLAAGITAVGDITGYWDSQHTTEEELVAMIEKHTSTPHPSAQTQIDSNRRLSICSTVSIQITIVAQQIWEMEQHNSNSARLAEKRQELKNLEAKYNLYKCVEL